MKAVKRARYATDKNLAEQLAWAEAEKETGGYKFAASFEGQVVYHGRNHPVYWSDVACYGTVTGYSLNEVKRRILWAVNHRTMGELDFDRDYLSDRAAWRNG